MCNDYAVLARHSKWRPDNLLIQSTLPEQFYPWLVEKGSLTSALVAVSAGSFEVRVLDQAICRPYWHEQKKLSRPLPLAAMVREVELLIKGQVAVFARSIIPLALANSGHGGLGNLGRKPLGHLLFQDGRMRVSKREFAEIDAGGRVIHARRTPYDYLGHQILVSEFFIADPHQL